MEHRYLLLLLLLCHVWTSQVLGITVTSHGEPRPTDMKPKVESTTLPTISSRNFTQALQLLERMLISQQRQRRLIPYYTYYVVNDRNNLAYQQPTPTPFPVQNTALDLLARSIFAPYPNLNYVPQPQYRPRKPTYNQFLNIFPQQYQNDLFGPTKSYSHIRFPEAREPIIPVTYRIPTVEQRPSLPKLLSPLASVTKFPVPVIKKNNKNAPGRPGVDYPNYHKIPPTSFSCRTQRYKGFFADPETSCQVWHYCDFNGGQASFLCPNGTIFSQVLLTCDWWFNVKCTNTLQAYVLNERLYKFIMPKKPSFPEDYSGLQVDDYLIQKQPELRQKELAKQERLKKKYKEFEFDDVDALQELLDKMRRGEPLDDSKEDSEEADNVHDSDESGVGEDLATKK